MTNFELKDCDVNKDGTHKESIFHRMENTMRQPLSSIIIPIFNDWEKFLDTANKMPTTDEYELICVDNLSDTVPESLPSKIIFVECSKAGSYAARNQGVEHSSGKYLIFTDADCIPETDWANQLVIYAEANPGAIIAGDVVMTTRSNPNLAECYDLLFGLPQKLYSHSNLAVTANLLVPKEIFKKVNGFSENSYSGGDMHFCKKVNDRGYKLIFAENAIVYHPARRTLRELTKKIRRVNAGRLHSKHGISKILYLFKIFVPPLRLILFGLQKRYGTFIKIKGLFTMFIIWPYVVISTILTIIFRTQFR